jgi:hypothetical protein
MMSLGPISPATPPSEAEAARLHLDAEFEYLRVALNIAARRLERVGLLPGRGTGTFTADPFLRVPAPDPLEADTLGEAAARREALIAMLASRQVEPPLARLMRRLALDDDDRLLLMVALASEFAADFRTIFAMFDPRGREVPTVATVLMALVPAPRWLAVRARLDPDAPLVRHGLIATDAHHEGPPGLHDLLKPALRLVRFARGDAGLDPTLRAYAALFPAGEIPSEMLLAPDARTRFDHFVAVVEASEDAAADNRPLFLLRGPGGSGRARWLRELAARRRQATLIVDLHAAAMDARSETHASPLVTALTASLREARLHDAVLGLRNFDRFTEQTQPAGGEDDDESLKVAAPTHHLSLRLEQALAGHPSPVALLLPTEYAEMPELRRPVEIIDVGLLDSPTAEALWTRHLPPERLVDGLTSKDLVAAFRVTPGELETASNEALRTLRIRRHGGRNELDRVDVALVQDIIKAQRRHRLRDIATLMSRGYTWSDLVAPPMVFAQLRELLSRYRFRHHVMEVWGLKRRFGEAQGISALFEGPPGTGKTMAAHIVARELGLDLFQVDLSKIMSKYIGETEKHLAVLFDEAERAQALILFDEADSLFAKRTEVKDSHDRHANLKVNYLLQRIERFSGIAVLTTNLPENFDEAFGRRVTVKVHFPKPDLEARKTLWTSMLNGLPTRLDEHDLHELAREFELTGGLIRNSVLRGAFMAAARDIPISYDLLEIAARIEQKHQGMLLRGDPLRDLVRRFDDPNAVIDERPTDDMW